jgi:DNA replication protein DnaC
MNTMAEAIDAIGIVGATEPTERACLECDAKFVSVFPRRICDCCIDSHERRCQLAAIAKSTNTIPHRYNDAAYTEAGIGHLRERVRPIAKIDDILRATKHTVLLTGPSGAGKTTLACAYFREKVLNATGMFLSSAELGHEASLFTNREPELIRRAKTKGVLLLDDLGTEIDRTPRLEASHAVGNVVQERHDKELLTIVTTFRSEKELEGRYGDGVLRRLFSGDLIELGGSK